MKYFFRLLIVSSAFFYSVLSFAANSQTSITSEFAQHNSYSNVKISPDGKHLAVIVMLEGKRSLLFFQVDGFKPVGQARFPGLIEVGDYAWVNSERVVISLAESTPWSSVPESYGELFAINYTGEKAEMIFGYRAGDQQVGTRFKVKESRRAWGQLVDTLPQDDEHILISSTNWSESGAGYAEVQKLNVYTGRSKRLTTVPAAYSTVLTNKAGQPRLAFAINKTNQTDVFLFQKDEWKQLPKEWFGEQLAPLVISQNNDAVLVLDQKGTSQQSLTEISFNGERKTLFTDKEVGITNVASTIENREVYAVRLDAGKPSYVLLNKASTESQLFRNLVAEFPGQVVTITSKSLDDQLWIVYAESDDHPGSYYLFKTADQSLVRLMDSRPEIGKYQLATTTPIRFESFDGMPIHGYLTKSAQANSKALVVLVHGGPHGIRDYWEFDEEVQLLSQSGFNVLQVNYRGSGGYGQAFQEAGYRQWGNAVQKDIIAGVQYVISQGHASADNVCIMGASFGGYSAVQSATLAPELFRCAVAVAGVYDLNLMKTDGDIPLRSFGIAFLDQVIGSDPKELQQYSPVYQVKSLQAPLLIIHGKRDKRAPISHANALRRALDTAGKRYSWYEFDDEAHGFYDPVNRTKYFDTVIQFLNQHLTH